MPTLNKTTNVTKKVLKWGSLLCIAVIAVVFLFRTGVAIKEYFWPTPPPPPTVSFGQLPPIIFPEAPIKETFIYSLETVSGNFPFFPDRATVFQITPPVPNLLNTDTARAKVQAVDFVDENGNVLPEKKLSPTTYQWEDQSNLKRILTMNLISFNFTLSSSYMTDESVKAAVNLPTEANAIKTAESFIGDLGLFSTDIDPTKTRTTLLTIKDGTILPATSFSTANLIRINFFQKDAESLPMMYPYPPYSLMDIVVAGGGGFNGQVVEAKYVHRDVTSTSATYPIKTAGTAFEELKKGRGYVASFNGSGKNIKIRSISLGYFIGDGEQNYLLPVVVFEGDDNFIAYVSAVTNNWIITPPSE